jgi:bile acid:Na+ symporter, BASS family
MKSMLNIGVLSVTVFAMLSVGLELEVDLFRQLSKRIVPLGSALFLQVAVIPAVGLLIAYAFNLPPALRAGILLVAACPVGDIANFFALIGRGNLAISVTYNAISCLVSPLSMTIVFAAYGRILREPFAFSAPGWRVVFPFLLLITVPIIAGAALRRARISSMDRMSRGLRLLCLAGVFALCTLVIVARYQQVKTEWRFAAGAAAMLALTAMLVGWCVSRVLKMNRPDRLSLMISYAVRNVGLATAIAITLMNRMEYAVFSTVYFLTEVALVLAFIGAFLAVGRRRNLQPFGFTTKT